MFRGFLPITMGLVLSAGCGGPAKPKADPPSQGSEAGLPFPTKVGTRWVYDFFDLDGEPGGEDVVVITKAEGNGSEKLVTVEATRNGTWLLYTETLSVSQKGLATLYEGRTGAAARRVRVRLPHTPGETWEYTRGRDTDKETSAEPEWLDLPAGRFKALRIDGVSTQGGEPIRPGTDWYATGIGLVKQVYDGRISRVLKSFAPGKE